jgi:ABC-type phosphonate transport system ATPase subunit
VPAGDRDGGGPALAVHGLSKRFGDRVAFQDVSLQLIDPGQEAERG